MSGRWRYLILVVLAAMVAACGGSNNGASTEPSEPGSSQAAESSEPSEAAPSQDGGGGGGGGGGGDGGIPAVVGGSWSTGTFHLEVHGDRDFSADLTAGGMSLGDAVVLSGADESGTRNLQLTWSHAEGTGGMAYTSPEAVIGATIEEQCKINLSRNEGSALEGVMECDDVEGFTDNGLTALKVRFRLEFKLST